MYRSGDRQREFGVRSGPYVGAPITLATKDLPRETRELLSAALTGRGKDGPIASSGPPLGARRGAFVVLVAGVLALFLVADDGFGDAASGGAIQGRVALGVYVVALAAIVLAARFLVRTLSIEGWAPLPLGRHLLPLDLVEVRPGTVTLRPFGEARDVRVDEEARSVRILYSDSSLEALDAKPAAKNEPSLWVRILDAQHALEEATLAGSAKDDPLAALRGDDGFASEWRSRAVSPARLPKPPSRAFVPVALAACAAFAFAFLLARNAASDDAMFSQATRARASNAYRQYLSAGGTRHAAEVRAALLPRVTLDEATARGGIQPFRAFLREFPSSSFDREARDRFDAACRAELAASGTFDAIHAFEESSPDCNLGAEIESARIKLHEALLARARARGISGLRDYARRFPNGPLADRTSAALRAAYEDVRNKVRQSSERAELRDALIELVDRSEAEGRSTTLFVPLTLREDGWGDRSRRTILDAFDRRLSDMLDPAVAYVYHPFSSNGLDSKKSVILAIDLGMGHDFVMQARYSLSGAHEAKWSAPLEQVRDDVSLGEDLARFAVHSE